MWQLGELYRRDDRRGNPLYSLRETPRLESLGYGLLYSLSTLWAMGGVGVVAVTWALFFPPTRPREVTGNQGGTP
jgi:hypothetical protein